MSPRDLSAILDFMYNGEVNVKQEHLNSFLSVAEKLRVRGLCQSDSKPPPPHKDKESTKVKHRRSSITAPSKDAVIVQSETPPIKRAKYDEEDNDDIQEIAPVAPTTPQVKTEAGSYSASAVDAVAAASQPLQVAGEAFAEEYTEQEFKLMNDICSRSRKPETFFFSPLPFSVLVVQVWFWRLLMGQRLFAFFVPRRGT